MLWKSEVLLQNCAVMLREVILWSSAGMFWDRAVMFLKEWSTALEP